MAPHPRHALRALRHPLIQRDARTPETGPGKGPQNRAGIEGALLGTGAPTRGHAPRIPAPAASVGARVALDPAP